MDVGIDTLTPPLSILTCFRAAEYAGHEHATEECLPRKTHQVQENTCIDHHNVLRLRRELTQRLRWNWWCSPGNCIGRGGAFRRRVVIYIHPWGGDECWRWLQLSRACNAWPTLTEGLRRRDRRKLTTQMMMLMRIIIKQRHAGAASGHGRI